MGNAIGGGACIISRCIVGISVPSVGFAGAHMCGIESAVNNGELKHFAHAVQTRALINTIGKISGAIPSVSITSLNAQQVGATCCDC
ncbi:MAG: hypothetical protein RIS63_1682 [Bacteroidota bacterium]